MRFLISPAIVRKAFSTLVLLFAEVSKKGMPRSSAKACATKKRGEGGGGEVEHRKPAARAA